MMSVSINNPPLGSSYGRRLKWVSKSLVSVAADLQGLLALSSKFHAQTKGIAKILEALLRRY
jgi:hypothetical protein